MKKRICVIFTGGTIGSGSDGKNLSLDAGSKKLLLEKYCAAYGGEVQFDSLSPINVLSENMQTENLYTLYDCIKGVDISLYDGIIITHGTDTLCFTANWLSLTLSDIGVPVVLVSALYPLTDKRSHGVENFAGAVAFIEKSSLPGVYCSFKNDGQHVRIHLASRLVYPDEINGFYHSALNAYLAEIVEGEVVFNVSPLVPTPEEIRAPRIAGCDRRLSTGVIYITMRSLLNFSMYDFSGKKPAAVIVDLSHSGTICTEGKELNFLPFAEYCRSCGVEVIIAPVMKNAGVYASMAYMPDYVKVCYDTTIEMAITKVMAALGANLSPDAYFERQFFFEKI